MGPSPAVEGRGMLDQLSVITWLDELPPETVDPSFIYPY